MSTYFLAIPLGNARRKIKFSSSNMRSNGEDTEDRTQVPHEGNINHPMNIDELPMELKQQVEVKFNAVLKAFLQSCTKGGREKVTQFRESDISKLITSTSSAPAAPEVRISEPKYDDIVDPYPTHANYATMMDDHKKVIDNNLLTVVNMIRLDLIS
jgi:hypothetical protein